MRNWAGNIEFSSAVRRPSSVAELQQLVGDSPQVRALGTGHSFNAIADTTGAIVSTRDLGLPIEMAGDVAVVPGAATYAEVAAYLHQHGRALHNLGSLPHISVAGSTATGTHGSGVTNGCLATAVVGVELVGGDGRLVEAREGDRDFAGMVLSLGALGVVTRMWLRTEPTYDVSQDVLLDVPFDAAVEHVDEILASAYSVSIVSSFARPGVIDSVWRKHRSGVSSDRRTWGGWTATHDVHPLTGLDAGAATEQQGRPGPWHHRLPHSGVDVTPSVGEELQSEFFLPRASAAAALAALGEHAAELVEALQVFEMRTIAADDLWLSPFRQRDTVAVHATWVSDLDRVRPALAALETLLEPVAPKPHWGKVQLGFDAARTAGLYPELERFAELAERLDPDRCFVNEHLARLGVR